MVRRFVFFICPVLAFSGLCSFVIFQSLKNVHFVKFIGQAFAAIFNTAISAFAHG